MRQRKRYQKGSLKKKRRDGVLVWYAQWRDEFLAKRSSILGRCAEMTEATAWTRLDEILRPINAKVLASAAPREAQRQPIMTFRELVEGHYYPYAKRKWKEDSTAITTKQRMDCHLIADFGQKQLEEFKRENLQNFLDRKAAENLSFSVVDHLHRDLKTIFQFAKDEGIFDGINPASRLVTPHGAARPKRTVLKEEQVRTYLMVLELRERLIASLVLFAGLRPGEVFGLKFGDHAGQKIEIVRRVYKGSVGTPKNERSERPIGLGPMTLSLLLRWEDHLLDTRPESWLFPSENLSTPIAKDNCWRRCLKPRLDTVGLGWANFHVLRRTHSSASNKYGNDPKVTADQMGHGVDVNLGVYTQTDLAQRVEAATRLENALLSGLELSAETAKRLENGLLGRLKE